MSSAHSNIRHLFWTLEVRAIDIKETIPMSKISQLLKYELFYFLTNFKTGSVYSIV